MAVGPRAKSKPRAEAGPAPKPAPKPVPEPALEAGAVPEAVRERWNWRPEPGAVPFLHAPIRHLEALAVGQPVRLGRRALAALRFREVNVKEAFTLADSGGRWFRASLRAVEGRWGEALVYEEMAASPESPLELHLYCGVLARQRMMFVMQKATELGVQRIVPLLTERGVGPAGLEHEKAHAWPGQVLRAVRQCRRASVPRLEPPQPLAEALASPDWQAAGTRFFLDESAPDARLLGRGPSAACLVVGPEGGWSDAERAALLAAGAVPLGLGGRVLRAETAVVVGLALLQHRLGDLGAPAQSEPEAGAPPGPGETSVTETASTSGPA